MSSEKPHCAVDGCNRPIRSKGWCNMHYHRVLKHGSPGSAENPRELGIVCHAPKCEKRRMVGQSRYCAMHEGRLRRYGDLDTVHPNLSTPGAGSPVWKGDDVTYSSAHSRVHRAKGKASNYQCIQCGAKAADWAYDHEDESEKVGPARNGGGVVSIVRYSTNPDHYQPMCKPCHLKFDADERKAKAAELGSGDQQ